MDVESYGPSGMNDNPPLYPKKSPPKGPSQSEQLVVEEYANLEMQTSVRQDPLNELAQGQGSLPEPPPYPTDTFEKAGEEFRQMVWSCLRIGDGSGRCILERLASSYLTESADTTNPTFCLLASAESSVWAALLPNTDRDEQGKHIERAHAAATKAMVGASDLKGPLTWMIEEAVLLLGVCNLVKGLLEAENDCSRSPISDETGEESMCKRVKTIVHKFAREVNNAGVAKTTCHMAEALVLLQFAQECSYRWSSDPVFTYLLGKQLMEIHDAVLIMDPSRPQTIGNSSLKPAYSLLAFFSSEKFQRNLWLQRALATQLRLDSVLEIARRASVVHSLSYVRLALGLTTESERSESKFTGSDAYAVLANTTAFERDPTRASLRRLLSIISTLLGRRPLSLLACALMARALAVISHTAPDRLVEEKDLMGSTIMQTLRTNIERIGREEELAQYMGSMLGRRAQRSTTSSAPSLGGDDIAEDSLVPESIKARRMSMAGYGLQLAIKILEITQRETGQGSRRGVGEPSRVFVGIIKLLVVGVRYHYMQTLQEGIMRANQMSEALSLLQALGTDSFTKVNSSSAYWRTAVSDVRDFIVAVAVEKQGTPFFSIFTLIERLPRGPLQDYISSLFHRKASWSSKEDLEEEEDDKEEHCDDGDDGVVADTCSGESVAPLEIQEEHALEQKEGKDDDADVVVTDKSSDEGAEKPENDRERA